MTKVSKLAIWEFVLTRLQQRPKAGKMCICLLLRAGQRSLGVDGTLSLKDYPEFTSKKPKHLTDDKDREAPWWGLDDAGLSMRVKVVRSILDTL